MKKTTGIYGKYIVPKILTLQSKKDKNDCNKQMSSVTQLCDLLLM